MAVGVKMMTKEDLEIRNMINKEAANNFQRRARRFESEGKGSNCETAE